LGAPPWRDFMRYPVEEQYSQTLIASAWHCDVLSRFDVLAVLAASLKPDWEVERMVDPNGDISVIVLPTGDDLTQPNFVLYEKDGLVEVATIIGDAWQGSQRFPTCQRAVAAIVAASAVICVR
jgi:hypothetical protein